MQTGLKLQQDVETAIAETNTAADAANEVAETLRRLVNSVVEQLVTEADRLNWNDKYTKAEAEAKHTQLLQYAEECLNNAVAGLIGGAPDALNALNELAAAINNDPNFSASIMAMINGKADLIHTHKKNQTSDVATWAKQPNKPAYTAAEVGAAASSHTHTADQVADTATKVMMLVTERSKLLGIEPGSNKYTHPATHSADMISDSATKVIMTKEERSKLAGLEPGEIVPWILATINTNGQLWYSWTGNFRGCIKQGTGTYRIGHNKGDLYYTVMGNCVNSPCFFYVELYPAYVIVHCVDKDGIHKDAAFNISIYVKPA